jgi:hypothetical protein
VQRYENKWKIIYEYCKYRYSEWLKMEGGGESHVTVPSPEVEEPQQESWERCFLWDISPPACSTVVLLILST